ncbi:MAG: U32 family peptidase, partial [Phycisphaerales bacterium]|nr:U32 family peptidase [Phycisphaerales bacterium]
MNPPSQLELLAPAGSLESLRAALANGADAVYLGLDRFSARRRAENFSLETLPDALELTRRCGAKLYVAMNTLLRDGEVDHAATYLQQLCELGIDALIVQDPALAALAAEACPSLALHASTQLTLAEPLAITAAAERWGLKRVILPRETSLEDLATIRRDTSVELEMFVHGAMCISYSGQCQASRHLGHRSGNRGECAQPCRLDWEMQSDGKAVSTPGHHLLSPRDLCLANRLGDLATAGATSFKIEGRLKSPEYVAAVVGVYRSLLDDVLEGTPRTMTQSESDRLTLAFSRGFSEGYVDGNVHNKLVDTTVAGNVGLAVGVVTRVFGGETLFVRMREEAGELEAGDGLAFGAFDEDDRRPGGILFNTRRAASGQFEIIVGRSNGLDNVQPGDELYLTSAPSLQREIRQSFTRVEPHRRVPLCIEVEASVDTPLRLRAGEITVESETPLEASERKPLTLEFLQTQLAKLSNTPFSLESVTLTGPDGPADELGVFVPASLVNQLRRELTEALVASAHPAKPFDTGAMSRLRESLESLPAAPEIEKTILVRHRDQVLPAAKTLSKRSGLGRLWLELPRQQIPDAIEQCLDLGIAAGVVSPRVMGPDQRAYLDDLLSISGITGMLARNITALQATRAAHPEWLIVADWSLNAI